MTDEKLLSKDYNWKDKKIFISYNTDDYNEANHIYNMFKKKGIDCFLAKLDIEGGADWMENIYQNLVNSDVFILMLSPNFKKSSFCNQEAGIAAYMCKFEMASLIPVCIDKKESNKIQPYDLFHNIQSINYEDFSSLKEFEDLISNTSLLKNTSHERFLSIHDKRNYLDSKKNELKELRKEYEKELSLSNFHNLINEKIIFMGKSHFLPQEHTSLYEQLIYKKNKKDNLSEQISFLEKEIEKLQKDINKEREE